VQQNASGRPDRGIPEDDGASDEYHTEAKQDVGRRNTACKLHKTVNCANFLNPAESPPDNTRTSRTGVDIIANSPCTTMKISRNAPCPCGSGKKYKRCCGAGTPANDDLMQQGGLAEAFAQAIEDSGASTLDEMNAIGHQVGAQANAQPLRDFLGLSPMQMASLLYHPLESPHLVSFNEDWVPKQSMALHLFDALVAGIGKDGVKATAKGNLSLKLCQAILAGLPKQLQAEKIRTLNGIRSETEFDELNTLRILGQQAGLIKKRKNHFSLTSLGQELTRPENRSGLFSRLFKTYVSEFNWGYRDGYPALEIIQMGWLFSLYCISLFGDSWQPVRLYSDHFIQAFPSLLEEVDEPDFCSSEESCYSCYQLRTCSRFAHFWGLIDMRKIKDAGPMSFDYELQALQLSEWIQFHA